MDVEVRIVDNSKVVLINCYNEYFVLTVFVCRAKDYLPRNFSKVGLLFSKRNH
jgi:hypothetical protein